MSIDIMYTCVLYRGATCTCMYKVIHIWLKLKLSLFYKINKANTTNEIKGPTSYGLHLTHITGESEVDVKSEFFISRLQPGQKLKCYFGGLLFTSHWQLVFKSATLNRLLHCSLWRFSGAFFFCFFFWGLFFAFRVFGVKIPSGLWFWSFGVKGKGEGGKW